MATPSYNLDKIKFIVPPQTFEKAVNLYERGRVKNFEDGIGSFSAVVYGTKPYRVSVEARNFGYSYCECYLGQNNTLCKHVIAVAIYSILRGGKLTKEEKKQITNPSSSGVIGELSKTELSLVKKEVTKSISYIKYYEGPSRTWFAYQDSLIEGVNRLSTIISKLPVSFQTADLVVNILLRLDKKLSNGVDDSDGTIGDFMTETVEVLKEYSKIDKNIKKSFKKLEDIDSSFGWEEPLINK